DLLLREPHLELPGGDIEHNRVAIFERGDRSAFCRLWRDMAGHKTMRGSGKSTIRKQRDGVAQTRADNRGGHAAHLPHARAAGRPSIPYNDYIARSALSALYRPTCSFFPII